jgi:hypothetical protein
MGIGWFGIGDDLGALLQHDLRILRLQADELLAARCHEVGPLEPANADEIGLLRTDRPVEAEIVRRHRAVGFLADDDEALLGAQHVHRLGAVGAGAVLRGFGPDRLPDGAARSAGTLISKPRSPVNDMRKSRAGTPRSCPRAPTCAAWLRRRDVDALDQRREDDLARLRPLHGDHRPLLGDRGEPDVQMRELGLE